MRNKIYTLLVNKHATIKERYHRFHDGADGFRKVLSWLYLLYLNFAYYILHARKLRENDTVMWYEEKALSMQPESWQAKKEVVYYIAEARQYDVVSFDIFDTLIFRPFSEPEEVFSFIGNELGILDFKRIRMEMEAKARERAHRQKGTYEISLDDIWNLIEQETGISAKEGKALEEKYELQFCYANPFMHEVYEQLRKLGKQIVITSDMYLSSDFLEKLLSVNGFEGMQRIFVSNEYECGKCTGELFKRVKNCYSEAKTWVHIGDNEISDVRMAKKHGFKALYYPNINKNTLLYRAMDMSSIIGSAYRGIVNAGLYHGLHQYSIEYEYGFIYGGLFALGYCQFIHEYCQKNKIDKVLFLARDGETLMQVYQKLYPDEQMQYVYWSRKAATKLMACCDRYDYIRRFLYHKVNQGIMIYEVLDSMGLLSYIQELKMDANAVLTEKNVEAIKKYLLEQWELVEAAYKEEHIAAKKYFEEILGDCQKVVAVDIGWAGSGAVSINYLVSHVWKLKCDVIGLIAGTNTVHNAEPDASETFLQTGRLVAYLYSQAFNRDLLKKHDLNKGYNIFWELLVSSPSRQFQGFSLDDKENVVFQFGESDKNLAGIKEIRRGILAFVDAYSKAFGEFAFMRNISGRDAYAPMLVASSKKERYLKMIEQRFQLDENVT